jgi:hypothetical protein
MSQLLPRVTWEITSFVCCLKMEKSSMKTKEKYLQIGRLENLKYNFSIEYMFIWKKEKKNLHRKSDGMKKEGNFILNLPALDLVYLEYKPKNTS